MIPRAIERELEKLVRDRDRWKRKALDRAAVRSADRKREIEARDEAVRELLFGIDIEGLANPRTQSRGARGCLWRAIELLRPDIAATMANGFEDAGEARKRFFPFPEDV